MKEAIEAVIKELKKRKNDAGAGLKATMDEWYKGRIYESNQAIKLLEEVLSQHDPISDPSKPDGRGSYDTTQQMER